MWPVPPLSKRDAEALMDAVDAPTDELKAALARALTKLLGRDGTFDELVEEAAAEAGWPDSRRAQLLAGDQDALWDLAAELNEQRALRAASGKQQREVVSAIERAIKAVERRDADAVRSAAATIAQLDTAGLYPDVPAALQALADVHNSAAEVAQLFTRLREALGPGPLAAELDTVSPSGDEPDRGRRE